MSIKDVGFLGLGVMGSPMVRHLAKAGYRVNLFDVNKAARDDVAASIGEAATVCDSARDVAARSDVIITMLPNGEVVRAVVSGENGIAAGIRKGAVLLDTSSAQPWLTIGTAAILGEKGAAMVDAPVSGAQWGAEKAELVFMVGGAAQDVARIRPLLDVMGTQVFHLGELGAGHAMKSINNSITATTITSTAEGLVVGKRYGLDPKVMLDVLNVSTGGSWVTRTQFHQRVLERTFDDPFKLELMLKDIGILVDLAKTTGAPAPIAALIQQLWVIADRSAGPAASISELVRWVEGLSGTELHPGAAERISK